MFIIIMIHIKMVKKSINYQVLIDTVSRTLKVNRRYHLRLRGKGGGGGGGGHTYFVFHTMCKESQ